MTPPCVECKHYKEEVLIDWYVRHLCLAKKLPKNIVTGIENYEYCSLVRRSEHCPMFEQRIGIIQRILNWFRRKK